MPVGVDLTCLQTRKLAKFYVRLQLAVFVTTGLVWNRNKIRQQRCFKKTCKLRDDLL